ncbi:50S ribosomal protein L11 methyltransferase, partial [Arthrospira platensis SPKY1]|nr:50S ribosomal protein L11 methyltransferase [Arthrospira platensis SPKY1]
ELLRTGDLLGYVAPAGRLILSGIIDVQAPEVETAVVEAGGALVERLVVRDWVTLVVRLRP